MKNLYLLILLLINAGCATYSKKEMDTITTCFNHVNNTYDYFYSEITKKLPFYEILGQANWQEQLAKKTADEIINARDAYIITLNRLGKIDDGENRPNFVDSGWIRRALEEREERLVADFKLGRNGNLLFSSDTKRELGNMMIKGSTECGMYYSDSMKFYPDSMGLVKSFPLIEIKNNETIENLLRQHQDQLTEAFARRTYRMFSSARAASEKLVDDNKQAENEALRRKDEAIKLEDAKYEEAVRKYSTYSTQTKNEVKKRYGCTTQTIATINRKFNWIDTIANEGSPLCHIWTRRFCKRKIKK